MKIDFDSDAFMRAMEAYAERKVKQIEAGLTKCCIEVERSAKKRCPKDTTALRQSITYKVDTVGAKAMGIVGSELEYAPFVHEGTGLEARKGDGRKDVPWSYQDEEGNWHTTSGQEANPFLEDARNEMAGRIKQIMLDALKG